MALSLVRTSMSVSKQLVTHRPVGNDRNFLHLQERRKCLINDVLNTFYLWFDHMAKDHSESEEENLLPPQHRVLFLISSKGSFICTIPQTGQHIKSNVHVKNFYILILEFLTILSQSIDIFTGQIKYYLKTYTLDLALNLPNITIYNTTMFHSLMHHKSEENNCYLDYRQTKIR